MNNGFVKTKDSQSTAHAQTYQMANITRDHGLLEAAANYFLRGVDLS
jgi:hypothetical protein